MYMAATCGLPVHAHLCVFVAAAGISVDQYGLPRVATVGLPISEVEKRLYAVGVAGLQLTTCLL